MSEFMGFPKIGRLQRDIVITEKIDGTNAQVLIEPYDLAEGDGGALAIVGEFRVTAGSRNRWLQPGKQDKFGFAAWVQEHAIELAQGLGIGRHFGEWWGSGIQRRYGLDHRRFSLFNVSRWAPRGTLLWEEQAYAPLCCHVVPVLYEGPFDAHPWEHAIQQLRAQGSAASPGFMNAEGIVVFHTSTSSLFKQTLVDDEKPKGAKG